MGKVLDECVETASSRGNREGNRRGIGGNRGWFGGNRFILNIFRYSFCNARGARIRGEASLLEILKGKIGEGVVGIKWCRTETQGDFVL